MTVATEGKLTYFISDLHLGASYFPDPVAHERMVVKWLRSIAPSAARLYLVGDILDYWYEYRYVVPRGFTRFFGALAEIADSGVEVTWLIGNHDIWIFDYLPQEIGMRVVDGSLVETVNGCRFYISHGDGLGRIPRGFRIMRSIFRNRVCQRLFSAIHPRWTVGLAYAWSAYNRSHHKQPGDKGAVVGHDRDGSTLMEFSRRYADSHPDAPIDYFVYGHYHMMIDENIPGTNARMIILGDWIDKMSYAVFDGRRLELRSLADDGNML